MMSNKLSPQKTNASDYLAYNHQNYQVLPTTQYVRYLIHRSKLSEP